MPRKRRTFSIDFKKAVVSEYAGGEPLHRVARRNGIDPALLRVWVEKSEAGDFDSEAASAELVSAYERKIGALERLVGRQALEIEFLKGALRARPSPKSVPTSVIVGPPVSRSSGGAT
jgi:transposase-like protein